MGTVLKFGQWSCISLDSWQVSGASGQLQPPVRKTRPTWQQGPEAYRKPQSCVLRVPHAHTSSRSRNHLIPQNCSSCLMRFGGSHCLRCCPDLSWVSLGKSKYGPNILPSMRRAHFASHAKLVRGSLCQLGKQRQNPTRPAEG